MVPTSQMGQLTDIFQSSLGQLMGITKHGFNQ